MSSWWDCSPPVRGDREQVGGTKNLWGEEGLWLQEIKYL